MRGAQLFGKDVQLFMNMLARATLQGYTLRAREVKLLRRIAKDMCMCMCMCMRMRMRMHMHMHMHMSLAIRRSSLTSRARSV